MADNKVKLFLDYGGLQVYTTEMQKWTAESLTKFEYTKVDTLPDTYISNDTQPRYIYMYDGDNDGTLDLYMYVIITEEDTEAPAETTYKLIKIGSIALELAGYYTKEEITTILEDYVKNTDEDYVTTKQAAAKAASDAEAALTTAGQASAAAIGASGVASSAQAAVTALAGEVAKLKQDGVGGGCNCTAIESSSIISLFATLD